MTPVATPAGMAGLDDMMIVTVYLILAFRLFWIARDPDVCRVEGWRNYSFGLTLFCFSTGKLLMLFGMLFGWIFVLGHFCLIVTATLKLMAWRRHRRDQEGVVRRG